MQENKVLLVVDMQNDFITGSLGTVEAQAVIPYATAIVADFPGKIIFTRDTHDDGYLSTQEGAYLPVVHCVEDTPGWQIVEDLLPFTTTAEIINKPTFGSAELVERLVTLHNENPITEITLIGLCTDICVVTNALLIKTALPEIKVSVDPKACAGVSVAKHDAAIETMRSCQVTIL